MQSALCAFVAMACKPSSTESPAPDAARDGGGDLALEEQLMALGYLDHVQGDGGETRSGVVRLERARVSPGYTLTWLPRPCLAELIDIEGQVVRSWRMEDCKALNRAILLPDGDLLTVGGSRVTQYSSQGEMRWQRELRANHDVELAPTGGILTLSADFRDLPSWDTHQIRDSSIVLLSPSGERLDSVSLWDVTSENDIGFELIRREAKSPRSQPGRSEPTAYDEGQGAKDKPYIDLFHCNKVEGMSRPELAARHPLYALDNVLVTCRHQNSILAIDFKRRALVWAWGQDVLSGPHDATVLDSGNLLVFDNGLSSERSRVLEVDPLSGEIVWQYDGGPGRTFFTFARGAAQRLPNGNTLVVISGEGHAREVTPEGEVVWEYWNPHFRRGERVAIARMHRYPEDYVGLVHLGEGTAR